LKHDGADVQGNDFDAKVCGEESAGEATVTIAQDKCVTAIEKLWEIVSAAVFERFAEGEVFEPAIGTGDEVEVGWGGLH
jgi:hypothetical protein